MNPCDNLENYCNIYKPVQCIVGLRWMVDEFRRIKANTYLEIGCAHLATFRIFESLLSADGLACGIDLRSYNEWGTYNSFSGAQVQLFDGGSDKSENIKVIHELIGIKQLDVLFIDGDHHYEYVKSDWENYNNLVRPGGLIFFHDVDFPKDIHEKPDQGPGRVLLELKAKGIKFEMVPKSTIGTGLVRVNS